MNKQDESPDSQGSDADEAPNTVYEISSHSVGAEARSGCPLSTDQYNLQLLNERILEEISRREAAESALRESERRLDLALCGAELGIWDWNLQTGEVVFNDRWAEMLGFSLEEIEPHFSAEDALIHPEDREIHERVMQSHLNGKTPYFECEHRLRCKSGEWRWVLDRGKVVKRDELGRPLRVAGIHVDISGLKRAQKELQESRERMEAQLRHASKMQAVGTLAGGIAHDFNNILWAITGFIELAMDHTVAGTELHSHLRDALLAAMRAKGLVNQILAMSRQNKPEWKPIDVLPIVKEVVKFLQATIPSGIRIEVEVGPGLEPIMGDPTQIHQVLMNLCANAAHAMGLAGGSLKIRVGRGFTNALPPSDSADSAATACLTLQVIDTGHGMPTEIMDRAFEPYFTTKPQGEGSGLGLAVVHGIVKSHGGTLAVKSQPGQGSEFTINIPFTHEVARRECVSRRDTDFTAAASILFVDDELVIADMCNSMLADLGYRVQTFCSSVKALERFREQSGRFDLVITDLSMPTMNGVELACRMKEIKPDVPIILCTGYVTSMTEEMVAAVGIDALMCKPILMGEMADTIRKILGKRAKN